MTLLDQIKADREAGTPGPWEYETGPAYTAEYHIVMSGYDQVAECWEMEDEISAINARRIARVPDMEAALLAAGELADVARKYIPDDGWRDAAPIINALAAFRSAIEVK